MLTYWILFLVPALTALSARPQMFVGSRQGAASLGAGLWLVMLALTLLIGLRYKVGGDWNNYLSWYFSVQDLELYDVLQMGDPGYRLLNWLSSELGYGIYGVNMICGLLFSVGLVVFCRRLPRPWLAIAVAVPYMVIVVAMGYSRQGVALGLAMLGMVALGRGQTLRFVVYVLLGATFHKSAVILLPIAALAATGNRYWKFFWVGMVSVGAYYLLLEESVDRLVEGYIEAEYQSEGAFVRIAMAAMPAAAFLAVRRRFLMTVAERKLWFWFAVLSVLLFGLLLISPSTTAVDRIGLYMLPLQLVVFSHLPDILGRAGGRNSTLVGAVLAYYTMVLYVWLNFSHHALAWTPYTFAPFYFWSL